MKPATRGISLLTDVSMGGPPMVACHGPRPTDWSPPDVCNRTPMLLTRRSRTVVFRSAKERSFAERKTTFQRTATSPHVAENIRGES